MGAKNISEVRELVGNGPAGELFAKGFAKSYFSQALGVLPKTEIDLLVFRLLVEGDVIDPDGSIFAIARALNITPGKAKNLLFQYQLRCLDEEEAEKAVLQSLANARFSVDDRRLSFGIESPLARATVDGRLKEMGVYADISLSGDILKVPLDQFDVFIVSLIGEKRADQLEAALKSAGHLDGGLREFLQDYGKDVAKEGATAAGKKGMKKLFESLLEWGSSDSAEGFPGPFDGSA